MTTNKQSGSSASLSKASPYENIFGTRHRGRGRPDGSVEPVFVAPGEVDPILVQVAKRRAYAVVHEEQRERMGDVFVAELKVLKRRGVATVAADVGLVLADSSESASTEEE